MPQRFASLVVSLALLLAQPGPQQVTISQPYLPPPPPVVVKAEIEPGQVLKLPKRNETRVITAGKIGLGKVALSFDAGWEFDKTEALLKVLREQNVKATFFLIGDWVRKHPDLVKEIAADGHEIGNHSWLHRHSAEMGDSLAYVELKQTQDELNLTTDRGFPYYRPPFGEYSDRDLKIAGELGYRFTVMWSVDTIDWLEGTDAAAIIARTQALSDGGIALMHVGGFNTVTALPTVIAQLRNRGLEPVPLSQILDWSAFPMENYKVVPGDTVESIAKAYGVDAAVVRELNGLKQPLAPSP